MVQWGQGFQCPLRTGYNPQQFQQLGFAAGGIAPQQTGFPGQQPAGFRQPQPAGFPGPQSFREPQQIGFPVQQQQALQPQATEFPGSSFQQCAPPPTVPPVPPSPLQFQQSNVPGNGFLGAPQQPANRFMKPSLAINPQPLGAQTTRFINGSMHPLAPQMTEFVNPRLQMMSNTFLPANTAAPYNPVGMPQFQPQVGGLSLQQSFQQHNEAQRGSAVPKMPWALSKAEKTSYDQIFRAWDTRGTGFISGETALEVFGQSGLDKNDLAKMWALADGDNRGKLNLAEFHVVMGLIYRKLNGNDVPDQLPPELIPPSHRDLDSSVNFLKDTLKNDVQTTSPSGFDSPVSRMKERSFNSSSAVGVGGRQDATVYKYTDESPSGGLYQPLSHCVDRSAIRTTSESETPAADLSSMKRQLENSVKMLDRVAEKNATYSAEDDALDREMSDLRYRVKRLQENLDYVFRGPRSVAKDKERRKLERDLLDLLHTRVPEVEKKILDQDERKKREEREWAQERDKRNDRFGRYDDRDDRYSSPRYDREGEDHDGGYHHGTYDRNDRDCDRSWERDRDHHREHERHRDRDRGREYDRDGSYSRNKGPDYHPHSPLSARTPPPPATAPPPSSSASSAAPPLGLRRVF